MTNNNHTITPPPELVEQWREEAAHRQYGSTETDEHIAEQAARWGADQELEACCEWLTTKAMTKPWETVPRPVLVTALVLELRAARRPKPPSLKEQALMALEDGDTGPGASLTSTEVSIIRRALEALPDD